MLKRMSNGVELASHRRSNISGLNSRITVYPFMRSTNG